MAKKIKITEDQLKRLVENNKTQVSEEMTTERIYENPEEEQMNETMIGVVEMALAKEIAPIIVNKLSEENVDMSLINLDFLFGFMKHELEKSRHNNGEKHHHDDMDESNNFPDSNPMSDPMMNESIEKIKSNFKRFL